MQTIYSNRPAGMLNNHAPALKDGYSSMSNVPPQFQSCGYNAFFLHASSIPSLPSTLSECRVCLSLKVACEVAAKRRSLGRRSARSMRVDLDRLKEPVNIRECLGVVTHPFVTRRCQLSTFLCPDRRSACPFTTECGVNNDLMLFKVFVDVAFSSESGGRLAPLGREIGRAHV